MDYCCTAARPTLARTVVPLSRVKLICFSLLVKNQVIFILCSLTLALTDAKSLESSNTRTSSGLADVVLLAIRFNPD